MSTSDDRHAGSSARSAGHRVEKIGGTSMADTASLLENILLKDHGDLGRYGRIFVVSAYAGITNALLEHKKSGEPGVFAHFASAESDWAWGDALTRALDLMLECNREVFPDTVSRRGADAFVRERVEGVRSCLIDLRRLCSYGHFRLDEHLLTVREMLAALGEAHSANNTVLLLGTHGIDARLIDLTGWRDERVLDLDARIDEALADVDLDSVVPIVTGYARCREAMMASYDRGYTEVTLARVAARTGASEAIIHKEFHLSSGDPGVVGVDVARPMTETSYDVADQLSNLGMEAIHPAAAKILRRAGVSLRVKNTFAPDEPGATIRGDLPRCDPRVEIVTGLEGVFAFEFFEPEMLGVKGYDTDILEALGRHGVRVVAKTSNANTITHYLDGSPQGIERVEQDLVERHPTASITSRRVALVSAIGRDLRVPGLAARILSALDEAGIEPLGFNDPMRKVDVQVIVEDERFAEVVRVLHAALVECDAATAEDAGDEERPDTLDDAA